MGPEPGPGPYRAVIFAAGVCVWLSGAALAWSPMLEISHVSSNERSTPRIACGASGNLHVVYINKGSPWQVYYRQNKAPALWDPVEHIPSSFATRPDVVEDATGEPHVLFAATGTAGALDLAHARRINGQWWVNFITATAQYEDQPHLVVDSLGRIHMVFTRGTNESSTGSVVYRMWNGSSWGSETNLGQVTQAYYHRPDISIDALGRAHVTWIEKVGSAWKVRYRRFDGSGWSTTADVGSGADGASFFAYAKIAAMSTDNVLVVWHDDASGGGSNILYNYSSNAGAGWAFQQGQVLYAGHYPRLEPGQGAIHLISNQEPTERVLIYSRWNGSSWTVLQQVIATNSNWKGWPDIAADAGGHLHAVWDEAGGHLIAYSTTRPNEPPGNPVNFVSTAGHNRVALSWTNPGDMDFAGTMVRAGTSGHPSSPGEGQLVADLAGVPGAPASAQHTPVVNGVTYYYAAFSRDTGGLYSAAVLSAATPYVPPDMDRDGDVDQADFGLFQSCMSGSFVPQTDPSCAQARFDSDDDVDQDDAAIFMDCMTGPDVAYEPDCAG